MKFSTYNEVFFLMLPDSRLNIKRNSDNTGYIDFSMTPVTILQSFNKAIPETLVGFG